jgi:hypothetical protein
MLIYEKENPKQLICKNIYKNDKRIILSITLSVSTYLHIVKKRGNEQQKEKSKKLGLIKSLTVVVIASYRPLLLALT